MPSWHGGKELVDIANREELYGVMEGGTEVLVFDTNVLVHAANQDSALHLACRQRLEQARRDPSPAFVTWSICYEFLRVSTHPRALQSPWDARDAGRLLSTVLASPGFELLVATPRHAAVLEQTLSELPDLRGNVMHDLHTVVLSRIRLLATCAVVVVATASCGGDSGPTAPSPQPQIPNVAGTYSGPLTTHRLGRRWRVDGESERKPCK